MNPIGKPFDADLLKIKSMLQQPGADFSVIQSALFDLTETNLAFRSAGRVLDKLEPVDAALVQAGMKARGNDFSKASFKMFTHLAEHHFIHGSMGFGMMNLATLILFTDIKVGMLTFCTLGSPKVEYLRLTSTKLPATDGNAPLN
jgi:hypothetical protein